MRKLAVALTFVLLLAAAFHNPTEERAEAVTITPKETVILFITSLQDFAYDRACVYVSPHSSLARKDCETRVGAKLGPYFYDQKHEKFRVFIKGNKGVAQARTGKKFFFELTADQHFLKTFKDCHDPKLTPTFKNVCSTLRKKMK